MKKMMILLMTLILTAVFLSLACAETVTARQIILLTEYQQMGWGETFQLGAVDSEGRLWIYQSDSRGDVPYGKEELLVWTETTDKLELRGTLRKDEMTDLVSLIRTVPAQEAVYSNGACDAGVQTSLTIRENRNGETEVIVLGASGDCTCENTDPAAQSLYRTLRTLFPGIVDYDGDALMAPAGFQKTDLLTFCGVEGIDLSKLTMTAYANDCEEGASEIEPRMSADEIMSMTVTGKKNSLATTGNTMTYCFLDAEGNMVDAFEFYGDLLVRPDGMYALGK